MSFESALSFFIAIVIFSITPGPGVFAILARALVSGTRSCFFLSLGMAISDIVYLIAACFGLAALATHWGDVFTIVRWAGAAYLIYLGWKMWTAKPDLSVEAPKSSRSGMALSFLQGFMISASNPKVILFYIAFLPTFLDVEQLSGADIVLASVLSLIGLMLGLTSIAYFASRARRLLKSETGVKRLNRAAGSIMVGAGAFLATRT
ncbi:MAG: LysE family translocator [Cohaesibacter sp.]|jgi:threonine/homoserine/homoserine lactone efflux protein|nr:LysE family translocator [Cohaesibacter sp.]